MTDKGCTKDAGADGWGQGTSTALYTVDLAKKTFWDLSR